MALSDPIVATPVALHSTTHARSVQWGAVILGTIGAMAISMVLPPPFFQGVRR